MTNYQTDLIGNDLAAAGMKEELAKKVAYAIQSQGQKVDLSHLATKDDLTHEIKTLRSDLMLHISNVEKDLIKAINSALTKQTFIIILSIVTILGAVKYFG